VSENVITECPFCEFEADLPDDLKTAPEQAPARVHRHVEEQHPDKADELSEYTASTDS
jgi:hypothetical protein